MKKITVLPLIPLLALAIFIPITAESAVRNVCKSGCPYILIQAAIDASSSGDTILVHDGTYVENIDYKGKAVTVRSASGPSATIIDGDDDGTVVTFKSGEGAGSVLDGFTLTNGNGNMGGGIYCTNSSPTIKNCVVTGNEAEWGGGLFLNFSSPVVTDCAFSGNSTKNSGGGIYVEGNTELDNPTITRCTISENLAYDGGGLALYNNATVTDCVISGNTVTYIGGGIMVYSASPDISRCTISGNYAPDGGGGIIYRYSANTRIAYSEISGNNSTYGGGISVYESSPSIYACSISNNYGWAGGGIECRNQGNPTVERCAISGNEGRVGGGIYSWDNSSPMVTNCTISGNKVYNGGGVLCELTSSIYIINSTITGNRADNEGGGAWISTNSTLTMVNGVLWGNGPYEIENDSGSTIGISYSDVEGGDPGNPGSPWPGDGNIDADPLFIDPRPYSEAPTAGGDYRLQTGSPCVDTGTAFIGAPDNDQGGDPRPQGPGYDIGADELALLYNGSFEEVDERIPVPWSGKKLRARDGRITGKAHSGTSSFKLTGSAAKKRLLQVISIAGSGGDTFTLGGWSLARGALAGGGFYGLEAKFFHTDGTKKTYKAAFTKGTHGWEYKQKTFTAEKDYNKVVVSLRYSRQGGKAWFDDAALARIP